MLIDLRPRLDDPAVRDLLAESMFDPAPDRLDELAANYRSAPERQLLGIDHGDGVIACVGLTLGAAGVAVVTNIAVAPLARGRGLGRTLIDSAAALFALSTLEAETDRDAVEFYRHCGFAIHSLGERYPGTERFRCTRAFPQKLESRTRAVALIFDDGRVVVLHRWKYSSGARPWT